MFGRSKRKGKKIKPAKRVGGLTYEAEKKIVKSIAKRLHPFFTPNRLTLISFVASFLTGLSYFLARFSKWWLIAASFFLIIVWWGDSLDGAVARIRKITRERFGYYLDHIVDMIGVFFIVLGMSLSTGMNGILAFGLLIGYYLVCINTFLAAYTHNKFKLAYGNLGPTEIRIVMIIINTVILFFEFPLNLFNIGNINFTLWDVFAIIALGFFAYAFFAGIVENLIYLNKIDKKKYKEMSIQEVFQKSQFIKSLQETYG